MYPVVFPHAAERALAAEMAALRQHGFQVRVVAPGNRRGLRATLTDTVLLWHSPGGAPLAADQFAEAPRLRLVQALGSGAEAIDLAAKARNIAVCVAPGADAGADARLPAPPARARPGQPDRPLAGGQADLDLPVFDTTRIHAEAAIDFATAASS